MARFFNTTGPCDPRDHYTIPPERRAPDLDPLVQQKLYFVLHAARQTGKTTAMMAFAARLRGQGVAGVWATLEESQGFDDPADAEPIWLRAITRGAKLELPERWRPPAPEVWLAREIANPLYREVLARQLSLNVQESLPRPRWRWQREDGGLDMPALIAEFLRWWRQNAGMIEHYADRGYAEAVPHLAFMGFLQRVVNGGGTVQREYSANRGRVDLVVCYGADRFVIELKRVPPRWGTLEQVREAGVEQLAEYLDSLGEEEGWLLIFDQRAGLSWDERLWQEERAHRGRRLHLRGA